MADPKLPCFAHPGGCSCWPATVVTGRTSCKGEQLANPPRELKFTPCPQCGDPDRIPYPGEPDRIECTCCGYSELISFDGKGVHGRNVVDVHYPAAYDEGDVDG